MTLRHLNPPGLPDWSQTFSQVVVVEHPDFRQVLVSGQVGVDSQKILAGDGHLSLLGIQALADPQWLVEVEAAAVVQTGNAPG